MKLLGMSANGEGEGIRVEQTPLNCGKPAMVRIEAWTGSRHWCVEIPKDLALVLVDLLDQLGIQAGGGAQ